MQSYSELWFLFATLIFCSYENEMTSLNEKGIWSFRNVYSFDGTKIAARRDFRCVDAVFALVYTYLYLIRVQIIYSNYLISKLIIILGFLSAQFFFKACEDVTDVLFKREGLETVQLMLKIG